MALNFGRISRPFLLLSLAGAWVSTWTDQVALAQTAPIYEVTGENCKAFELVDRQWKPAPPDTFAPGTQVQGARRKERPDLLFARRQGKIYALPMRCVRLVEKAAANRSASPGLWSVSSQLGVISWQDSLQLKTPDETVYGLLSNNTGLSIGGAIQRRIGTSFFAEASAAFVYAMSDASQSTGEAASPISYSAENARVLGGLGTIGFFRAVEEASVGASIPLLVRSGNWPSPEGGYALSRRFAISTGMLLEARMDVGPLGLAPQVGFLKSPRHLFWSLQLRYPN